MAALPAGGLASGPMNDELARQLIGAWELVSYEITDLATGQVVDEPLGEDARGLIIYTGNGHMAVQISASGRPPYADASLHGGTSEERAAAAQGYLAYAGTYTVTNDGIVGHHVDYSLFPNWEATTVLRRATIDGDDRLHLELVEPIIADGTVRGGSLVWKRC